MKDMILGMVLLVILAVAAGYIYRAKKRGAKCIGCPAGAACGSCQGGSCGNGGTGSCQCHAKSE